MPASRIFGALLVVGLGATSGGGAWAGDTEPALEPPCRAEASVDPARAWVGQQVIYRVRVLRRPDVVDVRWLTPPSFRSVRAEWLPGRAPSAPRRALAPGHRLVHEERRALFPLLPGHLETPPARMGCRLARTVEYAFEIPAAAIEVQPLPDEGRPEDFAGVVGRVRLRASLGHPIVHLGESVRFSVNVWGAANVWRMPPPLGDPPEIAGADVFAEPPELTLDPGERLVARRSFRYHVVPRDIGEVTIPALRVVWFDPEEAAYRVERTDALALRVAPPLEGPPEPGPGDRLPPPWAGPPPRPWGPLAVAAALLIAAAWGLTRLARAVQDRLGRSSPVDEAVREAEAARRAGDVRSEASVWARALRAALAARGAPAGTTPRELAADPGLDAAAREAVELLAELDALRFAPPGATGGPGAESGAHTLDRERLARAVARLR